MSDRWEPAFLAVSASIGEPREEALAMVGDAGVVHAAELVRALRAKSRTARAMAIAREVAKVVLAIEGTTLA